MSRREYLSKTEPRWCSGCGDHFVLDALTSTWAKLPLPRENILAVSGIGCSSRLPYYTQTYGFHSIHGRAPTIALGAKLAKPELSVWIITGDGDALSIGGNHFLHLIRRNPDINLILFNNQVYGLTKGQASPTSKVNTPELPLPIKPLALAMGAGASFVARVVDTNLKMMRSIFRQAYEHKGTSIVEVYTHCPIFNANAFTNVEKIQSRQEHTVELENHQPMIFGKNKDKGLRLEGLKTVIGKSEQSIAHQEDDPNLAFILANLDLPEYPLPVGVLYRKERAVYEEALLSQEEANYRQQPSLDKIFKKEAAWQQQ